MAHPNTEEIQGIDFQSATHYYPTTEQEARETVCANCDVKLYQTADPNNIHWYHEGTGDVRCPTRFAEPRRVDPPAAPACQTCGGSGEVQIGCAISRSITAPCVERRGSGHSPQEYARHRECGHDADERDKALEDRLWEALKQHACKVPDEAKLIVFLSEGKFREAVGPPLATVRKETWEKAIAVAKAAAWPTKNHDVGAHDLEECCTCAAASQASEAVTALESASKQER